MKISTILFYVLPLLLLPTVTGWMIHQKGGMELLAVHWEMKVLAYLIVCIIAYGFYRLDKFVTRPKVKQYQGGIRRTNREI